jgi:hypothetical protein
MATTASSRREKSKAAKASRRASQSASRPSDDEIRILAYHLYERRQADGITGDPASDWVEAERRLVGEPDK